MRDTVRQFDKGVLQTVTSEKFPCFCKQGLLSKKCWLFVMIYTQDTRISDIDLLITYFSQ